MLQKNIFKNGFTMIEFLVVLGIIAFVAGITYMNLPSVKARASDAEIMKQVETVQLALAEYKQDNGYYPSVLTAGEALVGPGGKTYLEAVELTEANADNCDYNGFEYEALGGGDYRLSYCLSTALARTETNTCVANAGDICVGCEPSCNGKICGSDGCGGSCAPNTCDSCSSDGTACLAYAECPESICGDCRSTPCGETCFTTVSKDGAPINETYPTVQIGTQCWMAKNISNVGTRRTNIEYADDSKIEYVCYLNNEANCDTHGALYVWNEAMNLPAIFATTQFTDYDGSGASAKRRGVCPIGWHIPSDKEWGVLETYLDPSANPAINTINYFADEMGGGGTTGWRGSAGSAGAGTKLKPGGSSGFNGVFGGYASLKYYPFTMTWGPYWESWGVYAGLQTSTQGSADGSLRRLLHTSYSTVFRGNNPKVYAFSVRCIKD